MKIAVIHNNYKSPWISVDKEILSSVGDVQEIFLPELKWSSYLDVMEFDLLYFWFGSLNFLPLIIMSKLFKKKIVIIAGGYDVTCLPEIKYGAFCEGLFSRFIRRFIFKVADIVIGVSRSNLLEIKKNIPLKNMARFCYLGFKQIDGPIKPYYERKNQVVMISNLAADKTFKLKGGDYFLTVAKRMPHVQFILIGKISDEVLNKYFIHPPQNLILKGEISNRTSEFLDILNNSKVIFQHSMMESFCAAVVDGAMLGCLPIVSSRYSLPEIVGEDGVVVEYGNISSLVTEIQNALDQVLIDPLIISNRYTEKFSFEKRRKALLNAIL